MKTRKLIAEIGRILEGEQKPGGPNRSSLEKLLVRLAEKEAQLEVKLARENDEDKAIRLRNKIKLLRAQRKKGRETLKSLR